MSREVQFGYEETFLFRKSGSTVAQLPRKVVAVTILGGVQEKGKCGTEGCGHGGMGWGWTR